MTIIFFCTCLLGWCLGLLLHRTAAATPAASVVGSEPRSGRARLTRGVEDDPVRWPPQVVRGDWTELDDRQLIRLLTDSAHESTRATRITGPLGPTKNAAPMPTPGQRLAPPRRPPS